MQQSLTTARRLAALSFVAAFTLACGDSPTEPDDINPALLDGESGIGITSGAGELPQGAGPFTGPDGMLMDATAFEFVQQLTFDNGVVWKTSGISIRAVPDESVSGAPFRSLDFGVGHPGSLKGVAFGTYDFSPQLPAIDFVNPSIWSFMRVWYGVRQPSANGTGHVTIESVEYFDDVYSCPLYDGPSFVGHTCEYRIGIIRGSVAYDVTLPDGTVLTQSSTSFRLPIRKQSITLSER